MLVQVMACGLTTPSHNLNKCRLIINCIVGNTVFEMLNDFEVECRKYLIYDEVVKNLQFSGFTLLILSKNRFRRMNWVMSKQNE